MSQLKPHLYKKFLSHFRFFALIFLSPFVLLYLPLPGLKLFLFLPVLFLWNIAGFVIFPIQKLFGFNLMKYEEFGMMEISPEYSWVVRSLVVLFWLTVAACLAFIWLKFTEKFKSK